MHGKVKLRTINSAITDINYSQKFNMNCFNETKLNLDFSEAFHCVKHRSRVTSRSANSLFLLLRISTNISNVVKQWMMFLVLVSCVSAYKEQRFAIEPQDQSAVIGSRVTLPCRVEGKVGQLQWTKDDFGLGTHRHLNGYERYKMIGSDEEGDYSLDIQEVKLEDDALYQCQVSSGPRGEPAIRSRYAHLLVLVPPDPPKILKGPFIQAVEDRDIQLECISVGGKPPAEITWVDQNGGVLTQGVSYSMELMPDGRRYTARSILNLRPRRHHHNQTLTCQAQNTADRTYKSVSVKLKVQYAPNVRMFVKSEKGKIQEGNIVVFGCQANANPNILTYKWYVNNEPMPDIVVNEMIIKNISRKFNEATIKCEVHNAVGKSADTKTIEVAYGPIITSKPEDVEDEIGSTATLNCVVDGHPQPKIQWFKLENKRLILVGKSPNLTITVSPSSAGQYWCKASIENRRDVEAAAKVYLRGPPKIMTNVTQYGVEGNSVKIECIVFSIPRPDYIIWSFGGHEINSYQDQEYAFLEETLVDRITKSTLIVRDSQLKHFGRYNCTVVNLYGSDSIEIELVRVLQTTEQSLSTGEQNTTLSDHPELRERNCNTFLQHELYCDDSYHVMDKDFMEFLSFAMIITGISCVVIFFLVITLCLILCHRKNKKTDVKKPDITELGKAAGHFKDCDRNSNISDLKMEIRQSERSLEIENLEHRASETNLHPTLQLKSNIGLPLAGPVLLPETAYDTGLVSHYQRYSGDFNQAINTLNLKHHDKSNGYIPYVDYSRDYVPPVNADSESLSRSIDSSMLPPDGGSLHRQISCGRLTVGPDAERRPLLDKGLPPRFLKGGPRPAVVEILKTKIIPLSNSGALLTGEDARFAATYGNPYLRGSAPLGYTPAVNTTKSLGKHTTPPPYFLVRNTSQVSSAVAPPSSSRPVTSPIASSSSINCAQPQVPKTSSGALYILPPSSQGNLQSNHKGDNTTPGTQV